MGPNHCLFWLFCAAALKTAAVFCKDESSESPRWTRQSLPLLQDTHTELLSPSLFKGQQEDLERGGTHCGMRCQRIQTSVKQSEQERILGYETMYENGTRTHTDISLKGFNQTSARQPFHSPARTRRKRQVYGADGRFVISDSHFITNYPFSTAVRLSTGCSGVLISPKHVLTAAHCLHNGRDYLEEARKLRVGVLQLKTKRKRGGRRRGGRRRDGRMGEEEEQVMEEAEEQNSIDGDEVRGRKGGKGRRQRGRKEGEEGVADEGNAGQLAGGRRGRQKIKNRIQRSAEFGKQPGFRWTRVKQTKIPTGWILSKSTTDTVSSDYDYALLELKRPLKQKYMTLGVAPSTEPLTRIHFSGYDVDKNLEDRPGDERVVYRFCSVSNESDDLIYQHCDAQEGATGAGVYIRRRQEVGDSGGKGKWQRRVIGVFSGHQWVEVEGGEKKDFNVAVRITPTKYAQICHWIHEDPSLCEEV